jgi:hypothetical protein
MSLKQVRTLALAGTLLAGTTALAYAQSNPSSMGSGGSAAKHGESSSTLGTGASSATSGEMKKGDKDKSSVMKKDEENKSSAMKNEPGKSTSGKAENGKDAASESAGQDKSATGATGKYAAESDKNGAKANSTNGTMGKTGQSGTTGKGASANVNLTTQQKTVIKNTVIDNKSAPRVTSVNFNVSVGTVVPTTVHYAPLPASIIKIHPAWRGYDYFVYEDQVIVVEPRSHKIVEIIIVS